METTTMGQGLRTARENAGLTLRDVAKKIGVSHVYLGEVERGRQLRVAYKKWSRLVKAIPGLTVKDLDKWDQDNFCGSCYRQYPPMR
jgi:transcriptional regulator with XRE-family HTH domain